ncbi:MAG: PilN domain-containing protein [Candidatus Binatia bacterium]
MIRINLLPIREAQRALGRRQQLSVAVLGFTVAALVMVVPYVLQGRKLARLDREINELSEEIAQLDQQAHEVRDLNEKRAALKAKLKVIDVLKQKRVGPVRTLEDLSTATPDKLWLVDFSEVGGAATITGMALDNQTIAAFMRHLQNSKYFYAVDLVETSQSKPGRGRLRSGPGPLFKKFIIKATLDYLGRGGDKQQPAQDPGAPGRGSA